MNSMMKTKRYRLKTTLCSAILAFSVATTSSQSIAGGGGGGVIIQAIITLFTTFVVAEYITTALISSELKHKVIPSNVSQIPAQYTQYLLHNDPASIWMITAMTPKVRLLLAKYFYYYMFRYAAFQQSSNLLMTTLAIHPNALVNQATNAMQNQMAFDALQGFTQASAQLREYERWEEEYEKRQKVYLLMSMIMLQNPYSPFFVFQLGRQYLPMDFSYRPDLLLAESVTYLVLLNALIQYVDRLPEIRRQQARENEIRVAYESNVYQAANIVLILTILQLVINNNAYWAE